MKIHILGIGGTFMAGVAIIAKQLGHTVTGSDKNLYDPMKSVLIKEGIKFTEGYNSNILKKKIDLVIVGNVMSRGTDIIEKLLEKNINFMINEDLMNIYEQCKSKEEASIFIQKCL